MQVATYRAAYLSDRTVTLCHRCAWEVRETLGPVVTEKHEGECDEGLACDAAREEADDEDLDFYNARNYKVSPSSQAEEVR